MSTHVFSMVRFFLIFSMVVGSFHFYVWRRLIADVLPSRFARRMATGGFFALIALFLLGGMAGRYVSHVPTWVRWVANIWLGLLGLTVMALLVADGVRALWLRRKPQVSPERRLFLARAVAGGAATVGAGLSALGIREALQPVRVKRVSIALDRLPPSADGYRLVQISDVHVGPTLRLDFVEQVVGKIRALAPDLVLITGDLVDGRVDELDPLLQPLRTLTPRDGVFFVTGNHEYYAGAEAWLAHLPSLGVTPLGNERVRFPGFELAGVYDWSAKDFRGSVPGDVAAAVADRDPALPLILMAHQPRHAYEAMANGVDLQLSGHTHGGQTFPMTLLIHLAYPFITGLYRRGPFQIHVSPGTGYWGPPMRLGTEAEITEITLRRPV